MSVSGFIVAASRLPDVTGRVENPVASAADGGWQKTQSAPRDGSYVTGLFPFDPEFMLRVAWVPAYGFVTEDDDVPLGEMVAWRPVESLREQRMNALDRAARIIRPEEVKRLADSVGRLPKDAAQPTEGRSPDPKTETPNQISKPKG